MRLVPSVRASVGCAVGIGVVSAALSLTARQTPPPTPRPTLAAGASHSLAIDASSNVWAFGANLGGQIGDGSTVTRT